MKEIIQKIEEKNQSGFIITTNVQEIALLMDATSICCEVPGYLLSEDNLDEFIGVELLDIKKTDISLKTTSVQEYFKKQPLNIPSVDECVFVTLETSNGPLQFTAYNIQNGWYGHKVTILSNQLSFQENI